VKKISDDSKDYPWRLVSWDIGGGTARTGMSLNKNPKTTSNI